MSDINVVELFDSVPWPGSGSSDLAVWDGVETLVNLHNKVVSPTEVIEAAISRAEQVDPILNSISTTTYQQARDQATAGNAGSLFGIPTFIKDAHPVRGVPTRYGSRAVVNLTPDTQPPFIDLFIKSGLVSMGRSTSPEYGFNAVTESLAHGASHNPWDPTLSPGGSSGGSAALVAAGVVPMALASDGGGSIRIPSALCGLVGLKVSRNRYPPDEGHTKLPINPVIYGVCTRSVRDTAAFLAVIQAMEGSHRLPPVNPVTRPLERKLKIGLVRDNYEGHPVSALVTSAVDRVATLCENLGHDIAPMDMTPCRGLMDDFFLYWTFLAHLVIEDWRSNTGKDPVGVFEPFTLGLQAEFLTRKDELTDALERLKVLGARSEEITSGFDVVLSPVTGGLPPRVGSMAPDKPYKEVRDKIISDFSLTEIHNTSGAPSISLPLEYSAEGIPIGVQFSAPLGGEQVLLELAYTLEQAQPWAERRPKIFAGNQKKETRNDY